MSASDNREAATDAVSVSLDELVAEVDRLTRERDAKANQMRLNEAESVRLRRERRQAVDALRDALDLASEGWGYAPDWAREKWKYEAQFAALNARLAEAGAGVRS